MPIGKGAQSMERKYLSGNIRERLQDLMKERNTVKIWLKTQPVGF